MSFPTSSIQRRVAGLKRVSEAYSRQARGEAHLRESDALEVMLGAEDFDAQLAERYGWINRALPSTGLGEFVQSLAHRSEVVDRLPSH